MNEVLLICGATGIGVCRPGVCSKPPLAHNEWGSQNNEGIYQTAPPSSEMTCCHFRYQLSCVEVTMLHHSAAGDSESKWILHLELYLEQLMY